jgi:8-oxo-dGTP pyrophosphatase MutT (NUDIX family)
VPAAKAWRWADGRIPLPRLDEPTWQEQADFEKYARPAWDVASGGAQATIFREIPEQERWRADMVQRVEDLERRLQEAQNGHDQEDALQQPIATAIVTSPLGVLVGQRNDGKPPWTFIAGEVEPGERPEDAAVREVKEETGCEVAIVRTLGERIHPKTGRDMIYIACAPVRGTDVFVGDPIELADVKWVGLAEADELLPGMFEPVREYLSQELTEGQQ